jgi:hypothetical protein
MSLPGWFPASDHQVLRRRPGAIPLILTTFPRFLIARSSHILAPLSLFLSVTRHHISHQSPRTTPHLLPHSPGSGPHMATPKYMRWSAVLKLKRYWSEQLMSCPHTGKSPV